METNLKKFLKWASPLGLVLAALAAVSIPSYAANQQDATTAGWDQTANAAVVQGGPVPTIRPSTYTSVMNLFYTGTATAAYVSISTGANGYIQFVAPFNTPDTSIGGNSWGGQPPAGKGGVVDLGVSTSSTLGALCDIINQSNSNAPNWHCTLVGGVRTDTATLVLPAVTQVDGINNAGQVGGYDVPAGTATLLSLGIIPAVGHRVQLIDCMVNVSTAGQGLAVMGVQRRYGSGKTIFGAPVTDSTIVWNQQVPSYGVDWVLPQSSSTTPSPWLEFNTNPGLGIVAGTSYQTPPIGPSQTNGKVVVRLLNTGPQPALLNSGNWLKCRWYEK